MNVRPISIETFDDLEALFAAKGCSFARNCWCMDYRLSGKVTPPDGQTVGDYKKVLMRDLVQTTPAPGLIQYDDDRTPIGWVTLGPRETFARLKRSRVMKPVDREPVWAIVCFVVPSLMRGQGVAHNLLKAAVDFARDHGAVAIEGYPIDKLERSQPQWLWHGTKSMFDRAGFIEIARRTPTRPVMRLIL